MAISRTSLVVALGAVTLVSPLLLAQSQAPPASQQPGQAQTPPKSTAFILGQVIDGTTGQPIAEAIVTLRQSGGGARGAMPTRGTATNPATAAAMEQAMAGRGGPQEQRLMTGGEGRFVFHSLPPGNFSLTVALNGYSSSLAGNAANLSR
jgi:protocatechuate 3,4-dioxygenase beta subunit